MNDNRKIVWIFIGQVWHPGVRNLLTAAHWQSPEADKRELAAFWLAKKQLSQSFATNA
jgi:hypothetical protein